MIDLGTGFLYELAKDIVKYFNPSSCPQENNHVISIGYVPGNVNFDTTDLK